MKPAFERMEEMVSDMTVHGYIGVNDGNVASWILMYNNYLFHGTQLENSNEARTHKRNL